jgi:mono/diheme cytochrome c family protein
MVPSSKDRRAGKRWILGGALAAAALAVLPGCDLQESSDTERGEQLFIQKCGSCHALTAAGTTATVGPNLDLAFKAARASGFDQDTFEGVIESQIANPRPASPEDVEVYMPADLVTGDDAADVAAYVASVAGVEGIKPPIFVAPEFFATNCGGCHTLSAAGTTGTIGPNLDDVLPGKSPQEVSQSITDPGAQTTPGFQAGVMPAFSQLTPEQLRQLVAYLLKSAGQGAPP